MRFIDPLAVAYLRSRLDTGQNNYVKRALQDLCQLLRGGAAIHPSLVLAIRSQIIGIGFGEYADEKVRRWVLNTLARLGGGRSSSPLIQYVLKNYEHEPQTVASAISAIFKLFPVEEAQNVLSTFDLNPQIVTLAALQHVVPDKVTFDGLPVDVEIAEPDVLRLALIVAGLGRSPGGLFHPRHNDANLVRILGSHHDSVVAQYTVWAISENSNLGVADLGIDYRDIESFPANVRGWIYRLLAEEASKREPFWEVIAAGVRDPHPEARWGLAQGLRRSYIDVFPPLLLDWFNSETDQEIRETLLEHVVRHANREASYERFALEVYEAEPEGSSLRKRLEMSAAGMPIYGAFRASTSGAIGDLFGSGVVVMASEVKIGQVNAGAVSFGEGDAINQGVGVASATFHVDKYRETLDELEDILVSRVQEEKKRTPLLRAVREAKEDPNPGKVRRLLDLFGSAGDLAEASNQIAPLIARLGCMVGLG